MNSESPDTRLLVSSKRTLYGFTKSMWYFEKSTSLNFFGKIRWKLRKKKNALRAQVVTI